ncbi:MAG: hypothetical protein ACE5GW_11090, partial [Planctomycetota bacterium]
MNLVHLIVLILVTAVLAAALGVVVAGGFLAAPESTPAEENLAAEELGRERDTLLSERDSLREELDDARERITDLRRRIGKLEALESAGPTTAEGSAGAAQARPARHERERRLASPEEAEAAFDEAMARGDLEALFLVALDLLTFGEPGYEALDALIERFFGIMTSNADRLPIERLWGQEEVLVGRLLRHFGGQEEDVLRYGLYLDSRDPESLPRPLESFVDGLFFEEAGIFLLGYYDGGDPEILDGYLEAYRRRAFGDRRGGRVDRDLIAGIGNIPGPGAAELLGELLESDPGSRVNDIIRALAMNGSDTAIATLQDLKESASDERQILLIGRALIGKPQLL